MKKLSIHIKPLALFLVFLIAFAITGKPLHLVFSDCDHNITLHSTNQDAELSTLNTDAEFIACDLCKFTIQTPVLVHTPSIELAPITVNASLKSLSPKLVYLQQYHDTRSLRGPPSLS